MRCPKCHYLSFDPEPRCKNCGYDLEVDDADLALRTAEAEHDDAPLPDFALHQAPVASAAPVTLELVPAKRRRSAVGLMDEGSDARVEVRKARLGRERRRVLDDADPGEIPPRQIFADVAPAASYVAIEGIIPEPEPVEVEVEHVAVSAVPDVPVVPVVPDVPVVPVSRSPFRSPHTTSDLPLFVKAIADREALPDLEELTQFPRPESMLPPARPPLSVRRAAPEPPRVRPVVADRRIGPLDHDLLEDLKRVEREEAGQNRVDIREKVQIAARTASAAEGHVERDGIDIGIDDEDMAVEPSHRVAAAAIDVAVLGSIASFVFWATLRVCNINVADLGMASLVPLALFLTLMDAGYLLMFTAAGGQTVGKMVMGIRVVTDSGDMENLSLGQAAWRAVLTIVSVGALGLSWLPAIIGRGPALHDRLAHTRVIRA